MGRTKTGLAQASRIRIFENSEFGSVRAMLIDGEPFFVGKDVAVILGYAKPENAIAAHVDNEDKTTTLIQGTGSNYKSNAVIINESGLYSLILSSKLRGDRKLSRDKLMLTHRGFMYFRERYSGIGGRR